MKQQYNITANPYVQKTQNPLMKYGKTQPPNFGKQI